MNGKTAAGQFPVPVKGVMLLGDSVVLLENERSEWELPGGRLEPGETPEVCVAREIQEELGRFVQVGPLVDCWVYEVLPGRRVVIVTYGVIRQDDAELQLSHEHTALKLTNLKDLATLALPVGYHRGIHRWSAMQSSGPPTQLQCTVEPTRRW